MSGIDPFAAAAMADLRSIATAWEARATDLSASRSVATGWEARATDPDADSDDGASAG